ncbi:MAG: hypothetical protein ACFFG0_07940 [Candidatus Thorarchaeota archaeon]
MNGIKMKEELRKIFRKWCADQKIIIQIQEEGFLIDALFNFILADKRNLISSTKKKR